LGAALQNRAGRPIRLQWLGGPQDFQLRIRDRKICCVFHAAKSWPHLRLRFCLLLLACARQVCIGGGESRLEASYEKQCRLPGIIQHAENYGSFVREVR